MNNTIKIALIYGSTREGRFCDTVAEWAIREITSIDGFNVDPIDPAKLKLPARIGEVETADQKDVGRRLTEADAFVFVTPEYNHSFPAAIKMLIDLYSDPWMAKPVGFVSYGGVAGGLRAVEQLRQVFPELHAMTVRDSVSFPSAWDLFNDDGHLHEPERPRRTLKRMLTQLDWWARTLGEGRKVKPYGEIAE